MPRRPLAHPLILSMLLLALLLTGCGTTSADRLASYQAAAATAQTQVQTLADQAQQLSDKITAARAALSSADAGTAAKIKTAIDDAQTALQAALANKGKATQALTDLQAQIAAVQANPSGTVGDDLKVIGGGITAASPLAPPPYNAILALIGAVVGTVGGLFGASRAKQASDTKAAAASVVGSVSAALGQLDDATKAQAKATLSANQTPGAKALVAQAKPVAVVAPSPAKTADSKV